MVVDDYHLKFMQFVLPIMLALLASKYVGDMLTPGLFVQMIKMKKLPVLPENVNHLSMGRFYPISGAIILIILSYIYLSIGLFIR
jgi:hypothetical protein